jgi:acyl-CoA synthetase (AMP-forming)/AMP-acid ligase II
MGVNLILEMAAAAHDGRAALTLGSELVDYVQLQGLAETGGGELRRRRAGTCAFVGVHGPTVPLLLFAAAAARLPFAPLNYRLAEDKLLALIARLDRPVIIADDAFVPVVAKSGATVISASEWIRRCQSANVYTETAPTADDDVAVLLFTSGTTATPKGVLLRHHNLVNYVLQTVDLGSAPVGDTALMSVPPYHIAGIGSTLTNIYAGRRLAYLPDFSPAAWLEIVRTQGVTTAMVVPTMLSRIVNHLGSRSSDVPSLRSLAYGGSRLSRPVLERALRAFPEVDFVNAYGLTETSSTIAILDPDDHRAAITSEDPQSRERLSSVGRIISGVEGQIRDPDGLVLPAGQAGELWVRGAQVSGEYLELGSSLDADGWFDTRDRGHFDLDGYLFIDGRTDDTIIRGAENIAPSEIEDVLAMHPQIRDVAVLGVADELWGQRIAAVIVTDDEVDPPDSDQLREWVRIRLRSSRTPDEIHFRTSLPYTPTGKLLRRELAEELASGIE